MLGLFVASPRRRYSLWRLAQRSHLVWPGRGGSLQPRHLVGPSVVATSFSAMTRNESLSSLAFARRLMSYDLRESRCFSAQASHLVCPGIAGALQCRQRPRALALVSFFPVLSAIPFLPFLGCEWDSFLSGLLACPYLPGSLVVCCHSPVPSWHCFCSF